MARESVDDIAPQLYLRTITVVGFAVDAPVIENDAAFNVLSAKL